MKYTNTQTLIISNFLNLNTPKLWDKFISNSFQGLNLQNHDTEDLIITLINQLSGLYIINMETGEITGEIKFEDILEGRATKPSLLLSGGNYELQSASYDMEIIDKADKLLEKVNAFIAYCDKKIEELQDCDDYEITGFFQGKANNYIIDGVMKHKPEQGGFWSAGSSMKYAELLDLEGNVTDEFYGGQNDFNECIIAKAAKGQEFRIMFYAKNDGKWHEASSAKLIWNNEIWKLERSQDKTWELKSRREA